MPPSLEVLDRARRPRNAGSFPPGTPDISKGVAGTADAGDVIEIYLQIVGGRVGAARFKAFGCSSAIAAASIATELALDRRPDELVDLAADAIAGPLRLAQDKKRYADLALRALQRAIGAHHHAETAGGQHP